MRFAAVLFGAALMASPAASAEPSAPLPYQSVTDLSSFTALTPLRGVDQPRDIPAAAPADRTVASAALAEAQAFSDAHGGKALLVWQGGKLQHEAYAPGFGPGSVFNVFSMTKSVLGLTYGAALRDGVIASLDDPVGRYVVEWRDDPRGRITLRQLLTMSSGLRKASFVPPNAHVRDLLFGPDTTRLALAEPLVGVPGAAFEYNDINPQIAGLALDRALRAAGKGGYVDYLSAQIWRPVGQADAQVWLEREGGNPRWYVGVMATPRDWLRLGLLVKDRGQVAGRQVLPASWIDEMTGPAPTNPKYGIQIWRGASADGLIAPDLVYFAGNQDQRVYISRALDLVIVRVGEGAPGWDNAAIPNAVARGVSR